MSLRADYLNCKISDCEKSFPFYEKKIVNDVVTLLKIKHKSF